MVPWFGGQLADQVTQLVLVKYIYIYYMHDVTVKTLAPLQSRALLWMDAWMDTWMDGFCEQKEVCPVITASLSLKTN